MQDCHQEGVTDDRKCDSPKRGVKCIREGSQLMERCDGNEGGVRKCNRRFVSWWGGVMVMGRSKKA